MKGELIETALRQMIRLSPAEVVKLAVLMVLQRDGDPVLLEEMQATPSEHAGASALANYIRACIVDGLLEQMKHAGD
jgi:hypothetical protein